MRPFAAFALIDVHHVRKTVVGHAPCKDGRQSAVRSSNGRCRQIKTGLGKGRNIAVAGREMRPCAVFVLIDIHRIRFESLASPGKDRGPPTVRGGNGCRRQILPGLRKGSDIKGEIGRRETRPCAVFVLVDIHHIGRGGAVFQPSRKDRRLSAVRGGSGRRRQRRPCLRQGGNIRVVGRQMFQLTLFVRVDIHHIRMVTAAHRSARENRSPPAVRGGGGRRRQIIPGLRKGRMIRVGSSVMPGDSYGKNGTDLPREQLRRQTPRVRVGRRTAVPVQ